jgi:DNA-binding CsgD family transcriptional regulator
MSLAAYGKTVATLFDAALDESVTPAALETIAGHVGSSDADYLVVNKFTRQVSSANCRGIFAGRRKDYLAHYRKIDPFLAIQEEAVCGSFTLLSERVPESVLRRDEWYNDYVLKGHVCDILGAKLHEGQSHTVLLGLQRAVGDAGPFPRDMEALQMLMTPLRKAAELHVGLIEIGYHAALARGALDHLSAGMIFTDAGGRTVETNRAGELILRRGDGLTMQNGRICARRSFETAKLASLIAKAAAPSASGPSAGCMLIGRTVGSPAYVVRVAPVTAGLIGNDLPMALILVSSRRQNLISERELSELYGLSPAESRIAIALAQGKRLAAFAAELGLQITTLRTQLSSILRKCEVERQSDLVRLVLSIPVVEPLPGATSPLAHVSAKDRKPPLSGPLAPVRQTRRS